MNVPVPPLTTVIIHKSVATTLAPTPVSVLQDIDSTAIAGHVHVSYNNLSCHQGTTGIPITGECPGGWYGSNCNCKY